MDPIALSMIEAPVATGPPLVTVTSAVRFVSFAVGAYPKKLATLLIWVCESFPSVMFCEPTDVPSALRSVTVTFVLTAPFADRRKRFVRYPLGGVVDGDAEMYGTYAVSPTATTWS
jgi:hypothetical protein